MSNLKFDPVHNVESWCQLVNFQSRLTKKVIQKPLIFFCENATMTNKLAFRTFEMCAPSIFRTVFNGIIEVVQVHITLHFLP